MGIDYFVFDVVRGFCSVILQTLFKLYMLSSPNAASIDHTVIGAMDMQQEEILCAFLQKFKDVNRTVKVPDISFEKDITLHFHS